MGAKRLAKTHSPKPRFPITTKVTTKQRRQTPVKNNYNRKDNGQFSRAETAKINAIRKKSNLNFKTGNNNVNNVNRKITFLIDYAIHFNRLFSFSSCQRNIRPAPFQDVTVSQVAYIYFYIFI